MEDTPRLDLNMDAHESAVARLKTALISHIGEPNVDDLAKVLACAAETGRVAYEEVEQVVGADPEDALLLAFQQRLLVPVKSVKHTLEWDHAVELPRPGDTYKMPNVVRHLVKHATEIGQWDAQRAVAETFREMGEPAFEVMPALVTELSGAATHRTVSAELVVQACRRLGMEERVDSLIAGLKAAGVMSPKLSSLAEIARAGMPLYELNPSVFGPTGDASGSGQS